MANEPSAWAMSMSQDYAACSSAIRSIDAAGFAHILDAAREEGWRMGMKAAADIALVRAGWRVLLDGVEVVE